MKYSRTEVVIATLLLFLIGIAVGVWIIPAIF